MKEMKTWASWEASMTGLRNHKLNYFFTLWMFWRYINPVWRGTSEAAQLVGEGKEVDQTSKLYGLGRKICKYLWQVLQMWLFAFLSGNT